MRLPAPEEWPLTEEFKLPTNDLLTERVHSTPEHIGLVDADTGEEWTYAAIHQRVSDRLAALEPTFASTSRRVGLLLEPGIGFAECYFAAARAGNSLVPLNLDLDETSLSRQMERSHTDVLVCDSTTERLAQASASEDVTVVSVEGTIRSMASESDGGRKSQTTQRTSLGDSERLVVFTSGTTDRPKGVRLNQRNLVSSAIVSAERLGVEPADRWLICLPMYHVGGIAPLVRSTLYGTTTVIQSEFSVADTARVIDEHDVTCVSLVPTMLTRLLDAGWSPQDSLRFVLLGGGPTPPDLVDRCENRGVPVCPTYGMTETSSQVSTALPSTAFEHQGTVGRPLRATTVTIVDETGATCEQGAVGELVVQGPTITSGYLDDKLSNEAFGEHGFETGDLGYRDGSGRLWIVGRADDRIVSGGENVQPAVVTQTIRKLESVTDAIVLGLPDAEWGELVSALVETDDDSLSEKMVLVHCRDNLAPYEVPKLIRLTENLPRTPSGTVDREAARKTLTDS